MSLDGAAWADGALFQKLLDETVALMRQTLDFVAAVEAQATPVATPGSRRDRLAVVRECSIMTARLTAVMSWLLAHRALAESAGDLELRTGQRPPLTTVLPPPSRGMEDLLGPQGSALRTRAADLYDRIRRLDGQLAER